MHYILLFSLCMYLAAGKDVNPPPCPDVSPCTCASGPSGYQIHCYGNHFQSGEEIREILQQDFPADFDFIFLHLISYHLPADLLGNKTVDQVHLACLKDQSIVPITVDPAAFSKVTAKGFHLLSCDLRSQSLDFLGSFQSLSSVEFYEVLSEDYQPIPPISGLEEVKLGSSSLASWSPWNNTPNVKRVSIMSVIEGKVLSLLDSFTHYDLEYLFMEFNDLEIVPRHLSGFKNLRELYLGWNNIKVLTRGSVSFSSTPEFIDLTGNPIQFAQPGAFSGDFSQTRLIMSYNDLEVMEEEAFAPVLEQMFQERGNITFDSSDFICDCSLAWLIRDNRRFLDDVIGAECSNGTRFEDLNPLSFSNCPEKRTTTTAATKTTTVTIETTTESAATTATLSALLLFLGALPFV